MNHAKRNPGIPKRPKPQKNAKVVLGGLDRAPAAREVASSRREPRIRRARVLVEERTGGHTLKRCRWREKGARPGINSSSCPAFGVPFVALLRQRAAARAWRPKRVGGR